MDRRWWHNSTVYQIYPKSFLDTNGDGIGDINGIISKLDYLKFIGIDILWLSPIFESPMDDNGYDISDYRNISKDFGTMEDMEKLISECKSRNLKIIIDLVVNHSSDEHFWFKESRKSKDNFYRDFYIWRSAKEGIPNDVKSVFGGSAWEYDGQSDEYYFHLFSKKQPDLNWDNENVRNEIFSMMNFWIDKGIDGFRMDVIDLIGKDVDNKLIGNTEKTHKYLKEMNEKTFGKYDLFTVGEAGGVTIERAKLFVNPDRRELHTVFQFEHVSLDQQEGKSKWDLRDLDFVDFKKVMTKWQTHLEKNEWNSIYFCNHDQPRAISRWGNDLNEEFRILSGKMLATVLHFMKGIPYVYQGEEIGMTNANFQNIAQYRDIETLNIYKERIQNGYSESDIMLSIKTKGRDNARTPMQWDESLNGGFTKGEPWIGVNENYKYVNVQRALEDRTSLIYYYKKLIEFRKTNDTIVYGDYKLILENDTSIFAYIREHNGDKIIVVCNFYDRETRFDFQEVTPYEKIISNYDDQYFEFRNIKLKPYESFAYYVR